VWVRSSVLSGEGTTKLIFKTFALKMAQAKTRIWPICCNLARRRRGGCLMRFPVSGFWFLVYGFWFLVLDCWFLVPGFWFLVSDLGFRVSSVPDAG